MYDFGRIMAKHYDKRITEALTTLRAECRDHMAKSTYFGVLEWLQSALHRAEERTVGEQISLDTHFSFNQADRKKLRAFFLVQRTVGDWDNVKLATERGGCCRHY